MIMIPSVVWIKKASQHKLRYDAWVCGHWLAAPPSLVMA